MSQDVSAPVETDGKFVSFDCSAEHMHTEMEVFADPHMIEVGVKDLSSDESVLGEETVALQDSVVLGVVEDELYGCQGPLPTRHSTISRFIYSCLIDLNL